MKTQLPDVTDPHYWLLFHQLQADTEWIRKPVREWDTRMDTFLKDSSVVHYVEERCVNAIMEYAKNEDGIKDILAIVHSHRGAFQELRKDALVCLNLN